MFFTKIAVKIAGSFTKGNQTRIVHVSAVCSYQNFRASFFLRGKITAKEDMFEGDMASFLE